MVSLAVSYLSMAQLQPALCQPLSAVDTVYSTYRTPGGGRVCGVAVGILMHSRHRLRLLAGVRGGFLLSLHMELINIIESMEQTRSTGRAYADR
eukprot:COSAG02_NODE_33989_length_491_cov_0.801020_1_plen_93_part_10